MNEFFDALQAQVWVTGSTMYGLDTPGSDVDYTGVFHPADYPNPLTERDRTITEHSMTGEDYVAHTASKFARLVVKGNFNAVDLVYHEPVVAQEFVAGYIAAIRPHAITKNVARAYMGYVQSQHRGGLTHPRPQSPKRKEQVARLGYDPKFACHLFRGIYTLEGILKTGEYHYLREIDQNVLKQIKQGVWDKKQVESYSEHLISKLDRLYEATVDTLPDPETLETITCDYFVYHS